MRFALFLGCKIPYYLRQYGTSTRAVLKTLDIEYVDIEFNCCGYPTRMLDAGSYLFSAARNLALAEANQIDILTPCKCCFGSLQKAKRLLSERPKVKEKINELLATEGLRWEGTSESKHLLSMMKNDLGLEKIKKMVKQPFKGLKIAAHYGCHALRPSNVTGFDNPVTPTLFEKLIDITGATSILWEKRLECCGNPLWEKNSPLSIEMMNQKLKDAKQSGADYLCVACTYCQIQFDAVQEFYVSINGDASKLSSILYPQLLGLSLGLEPDALGLNHNKLDVSGVRRFQVDRVESQTVEQPMAMFAGR